MTNRCRICSSPFERFTERKSLKPSRKKVGSHHHYGTSFIKYGTCSNNHYTKIKRNKVVWDPCGKCDQKQENLAERRRYIEAKSRKENKEIPTFIRKEFDRFGKQIKNEMMQEIRDEVRAELRTEIREELRSEMDEKVRYQVEYTINRILNNTPGEDDATLQALRVPPSPPSAMFSCSDGYGDM